MADPRNPVTPTPQDEMLEALVSVTAENTTTLIDVQHQAAATAASVKDARTYIATVVKNTDWETNGKKIAAILEKAVREDRAALHAAGEAAREMELLSKQTILETKIATKTQEQVSIALHGAVEGLLRLRKAHEQGWWRRLAVMALIGALMASLGLFGGYWWAKGNIRKEGLAEVGQLLQSSSGENFCGYMGSTVLEAKNDGLYCASWIRRPSE